MSPRAVQADRTGGLKVDDGTLKLRVVAHCGLHEIREAHEQVEAGGLLGKVVLEV